MIELSLMQIEAAFGSPAVFAQQSTSHRAAVEQHMLGEAGKPRPCAHAMVDAVIAREPDTGPIAERGPDRIVIAPYVVIDDRPKTLEQAQALKALRETLE